MTAKAPEAGRNGSDVSEGDLFRKATDDPVLMALGDAQKQIQYSSLNFLKNWSILNQLTGYPAGLSGAPAILCETFEDLKQYCYYVLAVGLICIRIFGYQDTKVEVFGGRTMGWLFQLTIIIRDIK